MTPRSLPSQALLAAALAAAGSASAQRLATPGFAEPVRVHLGQRYFGEGHRLPAPVVHDANGDGRADIVIGDLAGRLATAERQRGDELAFVGGRPISDTTGRPLRFHNW